MNDDNRLLTIDELAQKLQLRVACIRAKVNQGQIPCIRLNARVWRFHWPTVLKALQLLN